MTYDLAGATYTFITPDWLWLLALVPLLWLPLIWQPQRLVMSLAGLLRSVAALLIIAALAGLHTQTILSEHKLALVAAADVSDSISAEGRAWTQEYIARLMKTLEPTDEFSVLSFAADSSLIVPPGAPSGVAVTAHKLQTAVAVETGGTKSPTGFWDQSKVAR